MTTRVTDFRIDKVEIWEADYYKLPTEARKLIEAYARPIKASHRDRIAFELPVYRWEEINAVLMRLAAPLYQRRARSERRCQLKELTAKHAAQDVVIGASFIQTSRLMT